LLIKGFWRARYCGGLRQYGLANPESPLASGIHAEIILPPHFWYPITLKSLAVYNFLRQKRRIF